MLQPQSLLITSILSQFSIIFYKASFRAKGHEVPMIPVMYIAFVFQFSIIFIFLLSFSPHTHTHINCLYGGSIILYTRIHLILTSICYAVWKPFLLYVFVTEYLEVNLLCGIWRYNSIFSCILMKLLEVN